ncbi:unnamed protein product [Paramecium sonneborni]|uniref:Uncharacterized protein n=1 Tax=Paramecium sonneborni TaxID=65129 RepID=A0A8S1R9G3_9CILI|nr:unnamed protein product [Paramecium sonneborni]
MILMFELINILVGGEVRRVVTIYNKYQIYIESLISQKLG